MKKSQKTICFDPQAFLDTPRTRCGTEKAVVAKFGPSDFSEDHLAGQLIPMGAAVANTPTTVLVIDKKEVLRLLHPEHRAGFQSDKG